MQTTVNSFVGPEMYAPASAESLTILRELFELLEDYAPTWYTEELHHKTAAALGQPAFEPAI